MNLFGTSKPSENTAREYSRASMFVSSLLHGTFTLQEGDVEKALSTLSIFKGMVNRCVKRDQWDWFFVYTRIGEPDHATLRRAVGFVMDLRSKLKESVQSASEFLIHLRTSNPTLFRSVMDMADTYISGQELSFAPNLGRLTLFSDKHRKGVTRVTLMNQSVWSQLEHVNSLGEKFAPVHILHVNDLESAKNLLLQSVQLIGSNQPWTVNSDFRDLIKQLESTFRQNGLLLQR